MKKLIFTLSFAAVIGLFAANNADAKDFNKRGDSHDKKVVVVEKVKYEDHNDRGRFERHDQHPVIVKYEDHRYDRGPDRYRYERERYYHRNDRSCR